MEGAHCHAKVVEWGTLVIVCVGTPGRWWGAGCHCSIMVVVGAHGGAGCACHCACGHSWMVVALPYRGGGAGHTRYCTCGCSSTVVGCWSPFVNRGDVGCSLVALGGGHHWLTVQVGAHCHLLVVVHAQGVMVAIRGCL